MPTNPAVRKAIADLVDSVADLHTDSLEAITGLAQRTISCADYAGITVVHEDGRVETLAPTDPMLRAVDKLQEELQEGPCFDAATDDAMYIAEDLVNDQRWPAYAPKAAALGIGAEMGVDLHHPGKARAALNLYAREPSAFVTEIDTAELFASHAAHALGYASAADHFQAALASRRTIGQAVGVIMERYQINQDKAFQFLVRISRDSNVKLHEVAADIVAGVNQRNP